MDLALVPIEDVSVASDIVVDTDAAAWREDPSLYTAVRLSLFCNARALPGDELPTGDGAFGEDLGGWWGSAFLDDSGELGSRLWTLRRSALTQSTRQRARDFALEALRWLVELGIADEVLVETSIENGDRLAFEIEILRPDGDSVEYRLDYLWTELPA